jgi:hypothetical protein
MIYYTIYIKNLHNGTGYIDVALEDDQLLRDFASYLDVGIRPHRPYLMANPAGARGTAGQFVLNIAEVVAIMTSTPK